jgi:hypothetical protein
VLNPMLSPVRTDRPYTGLASAKAEPLIRRESTFPCKYLKWLCCCTDGAFSLMQGSLNKRMRREDSCESKEIHLESDSIHLQVNRLGWNGEGRMR